MSEVKYSKVIKRKDGRYSAYAWVDGCPRKYAYGKTTSECKRNLSDIIAQLDNGIITDNSTFKSFFEKWLRSKKRHLSPTTYERYSNDINRYVLPAIGNEKVCKIKQVDIQQLMSDYGENHAEKSSDNLLGLIHCIFESARINRIIPQNPCEGVQIVQTPEYEYYIYSDEEMFALLKKLEKKPEFLPIVLIVFCGLRPSEALAVKWEDINWDNQILTIKRTAVHVNKTVVIKSLAKTKESRSATSIPDYAVDLLRPHMGVGYLYNKNGHPASPKLFSSWFGKYIKREGLPHTRLYDLRHFTATTLMDAGLSDTLISKYMRHTNTNMTKKYQHIREQSRKKAANVMDSIFSRSGVKSGVSEEKNSV